MLKWFVLGKLIREIKAHPLICILLLVVLVGGFWLRVYHIDQLLGFYYDQGRDALTIWDIWHKGDIPFIGPTTGIAGIFRGPFYYWLIAPFYLLGGGNPVWPSVFLSLTTVAAVVLIYYLGFKIQGRMTGLFAAILASFSFNLVMASRWLSNPTPMLLLSLILVWAMMKIAEGKRKWWSVLAFVFGLSLFHFGSSGEAFYLPAILIFAWWQRKNLPNKKILLTSLALFLVTIAPLVAFDIKNKGLLVGNIRNFLFGGEGSFGWPSWRQVGDRVEFIYDALTNKLFNGRDVKEKLLMAAVLLGFIYQLHKLIKNNGIKILLLLLGSGSLGIIFFQGNFGNIYDYYLTGYYLPFILLFAIGLGVLWERRWGVVFTLYFIYFFLTNNAEVLAFKLSDRCTGPNSICLTNQLAAVDWIYKDAEEKQFNVDVYVPPVIPYAYDYLFTWKANAKKVEERVPLLYTLYEQDPPNPDRLEAWLARQKGIGKVETTVLFGGITVERRARVK